jgi:hypothetical protein
VGAHQEEDHRDHERRDVGVGIFGDVVLTYLCLIDFCLISVRGGGVK